MDSVAYVDNSDPAWPLAKSFVFYEDLSNITIGRGDDSVNLEKLVDEYHYFKWLVVNSCFGPFRRDVMCIMQEQYTNQTGRSVPPEWKYE